MRKDTISRLDVENLYYWHHDQSIHDAYKNPSEDKVKSYNAIKARCYREGGYDLTVRGHSPYYYTTMYKVCSEGTEYLVVDYPTRTERLRIVG